MTRSSEDHPAGTTRPDHHTVVNPPLDVNPSLDNKVRGPSTGRWATDLLCHPVTVVAVTVVIVNDRVLKTRWQHPITGKLSDVAAMIWFPLLCVTAVETVRWFRRRQPWTVTTGGIVAAVAVTAAVFGATKTWGVAADVYRWTAGSVLWAVDVPFSVSAGEGWPTWVPAAHVQDPTDLWALLAAPIPIWVGWKIMSPRRTPDPSSCPT